MGRPLLYERRLTLPLAEETVSTIDDLRTSRETRLEFIRAAIAKEIERRRVWVNDAGSER